MNWTVIGAIGSSLGALVALLAWRWPKKKSNQPTTVLPQAPEPYVVTVIKRKGSPEPGVYRRVESKKVYLEVSPADIFDIYEDRTKVQGDALFALYVTKWMRVSGTVLDIERNVDKSICVSLEESTTTLNLLALFDETHAPHLLHLKRGTQLRIEGRLEKASTATIILRECELLS